MSASTTATIGLLPTFTLIEGIIANLVAEMGESAVERVKHAFKLREEIGFYWQPNK
ncbi:MAG TPA: hypothetical protein VGM97_08260 [Steroidobacteraceae bacterium]